MAGARRALSLCAIVLQLAQSALVPHLYLPAATDHSSPWRSPAAADAAQIRGPSLVRMQHESGDLAGRDEQPLRPGKNRHRAIRFLQYILKTNSEVYGALNVDAAIAVAMQMADAESAAAVERALALAAQKSVEGRFAALEATLADVSTVTALEAGEAVRAALLDNAAPPGADEEEIALAVEAALAEAAEEAEADKTAAIEAALAYAAQQAEEDRKAAREAALAEAREARKSEDAERAEAVESALRTAETAVEKATSMQAALSAAIEEAEAKQAAAVEEALATAAEAAEKEKAAAIEGALLAAAQAAEKDKADAIKAAVAAAAVAAEKVSAVGAAPPATARPTATAPALAPVPPPATVAPVTEGVQDPVNPALNDAPPPPSVQSTWPQDATPPPPRRPVTSVPSPAVSLTSTPDDPNDPWSGRLQGVPSFAGPGSFIGSAPVGKSNPYAIGARIAGGQGTGAAASAPGVAFTRPEALTPIPAPVDGAGGSQKVAVEEEEEEDEEEAAGPQGRDPRAAPPWIAENEALLADLSVRSTPTANAAAASNSAAISPIGDVDGLERALSQAAAGGRAVCVKYYAPWCKACWGVKAPYEQLAAESAERGDPVDFYEVDAGAARVLVALADVRRMPVAHVYTEGELRGTHLINSKERFQGFAEVLAQLAPPGDGAASGS